MRTNNLMLLKCLVRYIKTRDFNLIDIVSNNKIKSIKNKNNKNKQ